MTAPKVTQADREAAASYAESDGEFYVNASDRAEYCRAVREGEIDADMLVQVLAAHRIAAEQSRDDVMIAICEAEAAKILHSSIGIKGKRSAQVAEQIADAIRAMKGSKT